MDIRQRGVNMTLTLDTQLGGNDDGTAWVTGSGSSYHLSVDVVELRNAGSQRRRKVKVLRVLCPL